MHLVPGVSSRVKYETLTIGENLRSVGVILAMCRMHKLHTRAVGRYRLIYVQKFLKAI